MGLGGTCHDYVRALRDGRNRGLSDEEIDREYEDDYKFMQDVLIPLFKGHSENKDEDKK